VKIYTKTGDKGTTSLLSGERVKKFNLRIDAYGTVDELNSFTGYLRSSEIKKEDIKFLISIQNNLFNLGGLLATTKKNTNFKMSEISDKDILVLENEMDRINIKLPKLTSFVLPGGNKAVALSHVCRSICRRAERLCVELAETETIEGKLIMYLNRLSDYFFVLSRKITYDFNVEEITWQTKDL